MFYRPTALELFIQILALALVIMYLSYLCKSSEFEEDLSKYQR